MKTFFLICTTAVTVMVAATKSDAMSINNGADLKAIIDATDMTQQVAIYIVEGRRYCFYFDGWHGAGWYRCGYARRHGLGWGGEYGWQGWQYAPYERRRGGVNTRERTTTRERTRTTTPTNVETRGKTIERSGKDNQQGTSGSKSNTGDKKSDAAVKGKGESAKGSVPSGGGNVQPGTGTGGSDKK